MNLNSPAEIAQNYIAAGEAKVRAPLSKTLVLAVFAGVFIALGGIASTTVAVSVSQASVGKLLGAIVFPGGLAMVLLAGGELFTGNCLLTIPLLERRIRLPAMLKNWGIVYLGNFLGALALAGVVVLSHQPALFQNGVAVDLLSTAAAKCSLSFGDAFWRGVACNFLVCIAVWISFAAKDVTGKIIGLFFPILLFVLCGFEHSVADMYFIGAGLFAKAVPDFAASAQQAGIDLSVITWKNFLAANLLPVTLGNIVGGGVVVGGGYWFAYLRKKK